MPLGATLRPVGETESRCRRRCSFQKGKGSRSKGNSWPSEGKNGEERTERALTAAPGSLLVPDAQWKICISLPDEAGLGG